MWIVALAAGNPFTGALSWLLSLVIRPLSQHYGAGWRTCKMADRCGCTIFSVRRTDERYEIS